MRKMYRKAMYLDTLSFRIIKKVNNIAGMDGYSVDPIENYADQYLNFYTKRSITEIFNEGINNMLKNLLSELILNL